VIDNEKNNDEHPQKYNLETESDAEFQQDEDSELFEHFRIVVDKGQGLTRIDKYITDKFANVTRNKVQHSIDSEFVLVNEKPVKANYKVKPFDLITISFPKPPRNDEVLPENIPLEIIYEDDDLVVVHKPAGMVVHPAHGNWNGTLVNALLYRFQELSKIKGADIRPGLVHRIDKDTSGLLVVAKNEVTHAHLAKQFFHHTIERTYYALVWGEPKEKQGTIKNYLARSPKDRRVTEVTTDQEYGKLAITHYKTLKELRYVSLVQCNLETGRTHQIRAHFKSIGHPLFNDEMYGGNRIVKGTVFTKYKQFVENCFEMLPRQALHAKSLGFIHPSTGEKMQFDSQLPQDFSSVLEKWEKYVVTS
jgi:23S rRNA pseudouridine1911/1915/1917 synthase